MCRALFVLAFMFYSTQFPGTETPITEGGVWTCGKTVGVDWNDPKTDGSGLCFGTQVPHATPPDDDSIGCLAGFSPNHYAEGVMHVGAGGTMECELLLRFKISAHIARGYEGDILDDGRCLLTRWNGALNDFTPLNGGAAIANYSLATGRVARLWIIGETVFAFSDGVLIGTYDLRANFVADGSLIFADGNPGLGFWYVDAQPPTSADLCWSKFTADDGLVLTRDYSNFPKQMLAARFQGAQA